MNYNNKYAKYSNKLIQIGSSGSNSSNQNINIFDDITMQYPDTIYKIIQSNDNIKEKY